MTWLSKFGRWVDPTNKKGGVGSALRELDPTRKASAMAGIGRALDVTNKNSLAGKIAPYAVGAIPGIGMPLAMGLGAGLRASQAVGRGDYGDIVGDALKGAGQAGMVRGIAQTAMPGTFAAKAPTLAPVPGSPSSFPAGPRLDVPLNNVSSWSPEEAANIAANSIPPAPALPSIAAPPVRGLAPFSLGGGAAPSAPLVNAAVPPPPTFLQGLGRAVTGGVKGAGGIAPLVSAGAQVLGAHQLGQAEDERLAMEREQYEEEKRRRGNRITFAEWKRRQNAMSGSV